MQAGLKPALDCIKAFSETDFTEDLSGSTAGPVGPGDDDQIVPIDRAGRASAKLAQARRAQV